MTENERRLSDPGPVSTDFHLCYPRYMVNWRTTKKMREQIPKWWFRRGVFGICLCSGPYKDQ